jgi:hypothetical protein
MCVFLDMNACLCTTCCDVDHVNEEIRENLSQQLVHACGAVCSWKLERIAASRSHLADVVVIELLGMLQKMLCE